MSTETYHYCHCLQQAFTPSEWYEYCRAHSSSEAIFTHKSFGFNINDVCLTPTTRVDIRKPYRIKVSTAESPNGRWDYGYEFNLRTRGCGGSATFCYKPEHGFSLENEAIYHGLCSAEKFILGAIGDAKGREDEKSSTPKLNATLQEIRKYKDLYNPNQLTLFDF